MNIEEFVNDYLQEHRHEVLLNPYNGLVEFAKVFQEKLMKDALMKDAVEGEVVQDLKGVNRVKSFSKIPEWLYFGDKVKIIICKKED